MASIFSKIIQGELPGHFVWQDDICVAIMTIQPINPGHLLLIPRVEVDHWDDLPADIAAHLMVTGQRLAKALKQAFPSGRVGLVIAGFEVPHTHLHLIPANDLADFDFSGLAFAAADELAAAAERIRRYL